MEKNIYINVGTYLAPRGASSGAGGYLIDGDNILNLSHTQIYKMNMGPKISFVSVTATIHSSR